MKKLISPFLIAILVFLFSSVCFAEPSSQESVMCADWSRMMCLAEETFPELKADIQNSANLGQRNLRAMLKTDTVQQERIVFQQTKMTEDGGVLSAVKLESGVYAFLFSANWLSFTGSGSARDASFQVWYAHIQVVATVGGLSFVYTPAAYDYFGNTGYAQTGSMSINYPNRTKISEDSDGSAYVSWDLVWTGDIAGIDTAIGMDITVEIGNDSSRVYVNGAQML